MAMLRMGECKKGGRSYAEISTYYIHTHMYKYYAGIPRKGLVGMCGVLGGWRIKSSLHPGYQHRSASNYVKARWPKGA